MVTLEQKSSIRVNEITGVCVLWKQNTQTGLLIYFLFDSYEVTLSSDADDNFIDIF